MTALLDIFKKKKDEEIKPVEKKQEKVKVKKDIKAEKPKKEIKKEVVSKQPLKKIHFKDVYKILKEPHISEKSTNLADENKYTFKVFSGANKIEIKKAIMSLYNVRVKDVNMVNIKRKQRLMRGVKGSKPGYKKAVVTLEEGYKIELMPH